MAIDRPFSLSGQSPGNFRDWVGNGGHRMHGHLPIQLTCQLRPCFISRGIGFFTYRLPSIWRGIGKLELIAHPLLREKAAVAAYPEGACWILHTSTFSQSSFAYLQPSVLGLYHQCFLDIFSLHFYSFICRIPTLWYLNTNVNIFIHWPSRPGFRSLNSMYTHLHTCNYIAGVTNA